jgi:hypothetical protein
MSYARRPCDHCGEPWSARAFYVDRPGCCKECHKARVNRRRADPLVKAQRYERAKLRLKRLSDAKPKNEKPRREPPPAREYTYHPPRDRAAEIRRVEKWRMENRDKARAIDAVAHAVRNYDLERPARCESCGTDKHVVAFHDDYAKPLVVTWSCRRCRSKARRQAAAALSSIAPSP